MRNALFIIAAALFMMPMHLSSLEVSPDGPQIIHLSEDAGTVIVGNPAHATVAMDNPRMLIVNAGIPGLTSLTVLSRTGKVILSDKIIVNGATENYVRVRNACINVGEGCQPTRMFYCETGTACHNVIVNEPVVSGAGSVAGADATAAATAGAVGSSLGEAVE
jgi:hypothetical protein